MIEVTAEKVRRKQPQKSAHRRTAPAGTGAASAGPRRLCSAGYAPRRLCLCLGFRPPTRVRRIGCTNRLARRSRRGKQMPVGLSRTAPAPARASPRRTELPRALPPAPERIRAAPVLRRRRPLQTCPPRCLPHRPAVHRPSACAPATACESSVDTRGGPRTRRGASSQHAGAIPRFSLSQSSETSNGHYLRSAACA